MGEPSPLDEPSTMGEPRILMLGLLDPAGKMLRELLELTDVNMEAKWWAQLLKQRHDVPHR